MKEVLIITGYARSGKDTTANYLEKKYGFKKIVFSDFTIEELVKRGIKPTKDNMSIYGARLRRELGRNYLIERVLAAVKKYGKVAICSVKFMRERNTILKEYPQTKMLLVTAPKKIRFTRRPNDSPDTFAGFLARDKRDVRVFHMDKVFEKKDYEISNNGSLTDLYKKIDALYKKIKLD